MKPLIITKVSELFEMIDLDLDGHGLIVTHEDILSKKIAHLFPTLENDMEENNG